MTQSSPAAPLPFVSKVLQAYLRSRLRGANRITYTLARSVKSLQAVPITIADWPPVYMDLRFEICHEWLRENPWPSSPREIDEQNAMRQVVRTGDIVLDIGANLGLHTALLSRLIGENGQLFAFEPNPELFSCLSQTIANMNNATLYPYALSNESTDSVLFVPPHNPDVASLADWTQKEYGSTHTVVCEQRRLDDLVEAQIIPQPDFIKCDVEGAELKVFQGGCKTLNCTEAPIVLFEANIHTVRGFELEMFAAKDFLESLSVPRYQVFEVQAGGMAICQTLSSDHSNLLAVPESRRSQLEIRD
ncbi:MAG: FkbM family methyltransferase [Phormidesmis sp. CAN_BIN36]|nr:FkbM family methyltransferase [Phormidesmis sp. CAN_BIN36]